MIIANKIFPKLQIIEKNIFYVLYCFYIEYLVPAVSFAIKLMFPRFLQQQLITSCLFVRTRAVLNELLLSISCESEAKVSD